MTDAITTGFLIVGIFLLGGAMRAILISEFDVASETFSRALGIFAFGVFWGFWLIPFLVGIYKGATGQ